MSGLTRKQLSTVRGLLVERNRILREEIRQGLPRAGGERFKDIAGMVSDSGDGTVVDVLTDLGIAEIDRDVRELREVEGALARIGSSDFGTYSDCGELIAYARLQTQPAAARCVTCQLRHERGHAHPRSRSL